jgi:hypothetical protein
VNAPPAEQAASHSQVTESAIFLENALFNIGENQHLRFDANQAF